MTDALDAAPTTLDEIPRETTQDGPKVRSSRSQSYRAPNLAQFYSAGTQVANTRTDYAACRLNEGIRIKSAYSTIVSDIFHRHYNHCHCNTNQKHNPKYYKYNY